MGAEYGFETKQQLNECILHFPWSEYPLPPLHRASRDGDILSLTYLTVQGDKLDVLRSINEPDQFLMWTPVHWAAYFGKTECVERLVSCGLKIDTMEGRFKQMPTHLAALAGHANLLCWLLEQGAQANTVDSLGETPVHKAARGGSTECLSSLHTFRASLNTFNIYQQTPYDVALSLGFQQCADFLKSHSFASVFRNQRKSKRIQDDKDHEQDAKRPRNNQVHNMDHTDMFDSNHMNHGLFCSSGTSTYSNGFTTNRVNGQNHKHEDFKAENTCSSSENNDTEMLAAEIKDTREVKYTVKNLNHPPRCLNLCGHYQ